MDIKSLLNFKIKKKYIKPEIEVYELDNSLQEDVLYQPSFANPINDNTLDDDFND